MDIWKNEDFCIHFSNDKEHTLHLSLEPKLQELYKKQWQHRKLTLLSKVTVIKTYTLPKLVYLFTVLPNKNRNVLTNLYRAIFNFIWDGKSDIIKHNKRFQNYEDRGLKLTDILAFLYAIKACWVKRITYNRIGSWKCGYDKNLNQFGGYLLLECDLL